MYLKKSNRRTLLAAGLALMASPFAAVARPHDGTAARPLRVILVPADGGTEDGTIRDFQPVFGAVTQATGLRFDIRAGQNYAAVVEAMCHGVADVAWFGPKTYLMAQRRGCAELLAIDVRDGQSVYFSGLFTRIDSGITSIADLRGRSVALGDVHSTSSFAVPVAMMIAGGVQPARDLSAIKLAGSHAAVLKAVSQGLVDAGGAAFLAFERAVNQRVIDPTQFRVVARSQPIPNPPLAMHTRLEARVKAQLREAFNNVHRMPGITRDQIRGFGGGRVDSFNANVTEADMADAARLFDLLTDQVKQDIINKAAARAPR